ncbi:MAG: cyclic-di-AMP receptor [Chloroflexi bacterium]|jgi:uncharacterized protein YaaQ|nr:cyclic-di-AMP receptor [Chloroflexota bacterium]
MKLIVLIVRDHDADATIHQLVQAGYRVTRIASTGGVLRRGQATLLMGVEDAQVEPALTLIRSLLPRTNPQESRGLVFVLPVERFEQIG